MALDLETVARENDLLTAILDSLHEGVYLVELDRTIRFWNRGAERITGYRREEVLGSRCYENILRHVDDGGKAMCFDGCPLVASAVDGKFREKDLYLHHRSGYRIPVSVRVFPVLNGDGEIVGTVETFTDMSVKNEFFERMERLERERFQDGLTGIGNRDFMEMKLSAALSDFREYQVPFGLLFADIDHFKRINDSYGHQVGDDALLMVARTLSHALRAIDVVCRWGGEEFVVLVPNVDRRVLGSVAERLRVLVESSSLELEGRHLQVTASIGGTLARDGDGIESVVQRADRQMYGCKRGGRNCVAIDAEHPPETGKRPPLFVVA